LSIGHYDVLTLAENRESSPLQGADGLQVRNSGQFAHQLDRHLDFSDIFPTGQVIDRIQVFAYRIPDVLQSLLFGRPL
jgi:hypothetical protein